MWPVIAAVTVGGIKDGRRAVCTDKQRGGDAVAAAAAAANSLHWFTASFLQPLPYLVTP